MIIALVFYEITELQVVKDLIPIAGLLGIMAIGFIILEKNSKLAKRLAAKFNKVWVLAELLLFVYIGTEVNMSSINSSVIGIALLILLFGLTARSIGVWISLLGSELNTKEKLFCVIAYWPKATVQAAIGAIPLTMIMSGEIIGSSAETGNIILSIAVLSIIITAPLGAIGIRITGSKFLSRD